MFLASGGRETGRSASRRRRGERGVWQRRFWDHVLRDERDYAMHMDYIHFNAVKHGYANCPHAWPHSSFAKWVGVGVYRNDWMCGCRHSGVTPPDFSRIAGGAGE